MLISAATIDGCVYRLLAVHEYSPDVLVIFPLLAGFLGFTLYIVLRMFLCGSIFYSEIMWFEVHLRLCAV